MDGVAVIKRSRFALILAAGASLAACAGVQPRYDVPGRAPAPGAAKPSPPVASAPSRTPEGQRVGKPYQIRGRWYTPKADPHYDQVGIASWYGEQFHNRHTANGEVFDMDLISAAHTTLPLPSLVEVTNLDNGRKLVVRINDRGPFVGDRIIDLSRAAAEALGYRREGLARVRVRYVGSGLDARSAPPASAPVRAARPEPVRAPERRPAVQAAAPPRPTPQPAPPPVAGGFAVQAAAFQSRANAEAAAARLASAGRAEIRESARDGAVLYRVVLTGLDEAGAWAARETAAVHGFPDARVLQEF